MLCPPTVEPVSIAVHAVQRAKITASDTAVVIGSGMIGLLVIQALRWAGAQHIIAVDLADNRLALARQIGATHALNSGKTDAAAEVAQLTGGLGADVSFEVVGFTPTVNLALAVLKRGGACVLVGNLTPKTQDFPLQAVVTKEITIAGSCASAGERQADGVMSRIADSARPTTGSLCGPADPCHPVW